MYMEFGNRLYEMRKSHGYSQDELADMLKVSRQAVSKWERGESYPDTDNLIALAKLYKISVDDLLGYKPENDSFDKTEKDDSTDLPDSDADECRRYDNGEEKSDEDFCGTNQYNDDKCNNHADNYSADENIDEAFARDIKRNVKETLNRFFNHLNNEINKETDKESDVKDEHIFVCDKEKNKNAGLIHSFIDGSIALLTVVGYLLLGFLANAWHPGWIIFLSIPICSCFVSMIIKKNPCEFPLALIVVAAYLLMGFLADLWHPGWIIFFAIPIYYPIADAIYKTCKKKK